MTTVHVKNLVKRFDSLKEGHKIAVNDVTFTVGEGEFLVLVGPSGCGKTTTLRLLAGLEAATSGEIRFGDRVVNEIRPRDRNVAMVFQDYAVFPHLTVFENIAYGLRSRRTPSRQVKEAVNGAAAMFRIEDKLKRKPRQLSGGERQRVALARAMVRDADLYLFDEPLSNLDVQLRHSAREDIMELHRKKGGAPSVYVTHDQSEAMAMGDRIAVMRNGRIEQIGSGADLYDRPQNLFVAYFLGSPSINLFDVDIEQADGTLHAHHALFHLVLPPQHHEAVAPYIGQRLKLGVRPEDLHVPKKAPFPVTDANTINGVLNVIEPTAVGCTAYLTGEDDTNYTATFKLRLPASYIGQRIPLGMNTEKLHLFEPETERAILRK